MTQAELLRYVADVLEALGIEYMIGGSQASTYYGEPRFTQDIDIVARLEAARVPALLARFPAPAFYVSAEAAREAVETRGQFNIIHPESGLTIDIFVAKDTPYDRLSLQRRHQLPLVPGRSASFARVEDVILYKLLSYREGGSEVHVRDILGMLKVSGGEIDRPYVAEWASRLGLAEIWAAIVTRAAEGTGRAP